jgi:hypothetical protein
MDKAYFDKNIYIWVVGAGSLICLIALLILWLSPVDQELIIHRNEIEMQNLRIKILELQFQIKQNPLSVGSYGSVGNTQTIQDPPTYMMCLKAAISNSPGVFIGGVGSGLIIAIICRTLWIFTMK